MSVPSSIRQRRTHALRVFVVMLTLTSASCGRGSSEAGQAGVPIEDSATFTAVPATDDASDASTTAIPSTAIPETEPPPSTMIPVDTDRLRVDQQESDWSIRAGRFGGVVIAGHEQFPDVEIEIDYFHDHTDVNRQQVGVVPIIDGVRYASVHDRSGIHPDISMPLLRPTTDGGPIDRVLVRADGDRVEVRFEGGTYSELRPGSQLEGPVWSEMVLRIDEAGNGPTQLQVMLTGLYYIGPNVDSELTFTKETESRTFTIRSDAGFLREYVADPGRIEVDDPIYGQLDIETDVVWLQVEWKGTDTGHSSFELDFDHAFKDRNQPDVATTMLIPLD